MFDYYEPVPTVACPWCGAGFDTWQGKDGPNALFVWRQGEAHPVDQPIVEESRIAPSRYEEFVLPDLFELTGWCSNGHSVGATGRCVDGVWRDVELNADDLRRAAEQRSRRQKST